MCLWAIYIFPRSICLFCCRKYVDRSWEYINRSQTHECRNWDWGSPVLRKGIHKWNFRCSACSQIFIVVFSFHTDKKENKIFLKYKQIQGGAVIYEETLPNTYMRKCANIRPLFIYDFATAPFWISLYMRKMWISFLSVHVLLCFWLHGLWDYYRAGFPLEF